MADGASPEGRDQDGAGRPGGPTDGRAPTPPDELPAPERGELLPDADDPAGAPDPDSSTDPSQVVAAPRQGDLMAKGALMAVGTLASRITGVGRDMAMTAALGLGIVGDIFTLGNSIPNTIYVLTVGGAMNAVFVPQLVRRMKDDSDGGSGFADRLITLSAVVLAALTVITVLLAPWLTRIYASPEYDEQQMSLAVAFARFCLPQVFFYGLFTLLSQVLNARGRFYPPMYAPIANNIVAIGVFLGFLVVAGPAAVSGGTLTPAQTAWLGIGSTVAVAIQSLLLIPFLRSSGYHWHARFDWRGWGLGRTGGLAMWTIGLLAANQVSYIVHSRLATTANVMAAAEGLPPAGIATYQKAYLIFFLPHSIVTVSLVTALLPGLSRVAHAGQFATVSRVLADTMRTVTALVVPITAVLIAVAPLLSSLLFGYGASGRDSSLQIGYTVIAMLIGLVPFSLYFILLRGWYSLEDTRTPFYLSLVLNTVNVGLSLALFNAVPTQWKVPALGLAFGATYWVMMVVAWPVLAGKLGGLHARATWLAITRMLLAGVVSGLAAGAVVYAALQGFDDLWDSLWQQLATLVGAGLAGLAAYFLAAWFLRIREVSSAVSMLRRRLGR